MAHGFNKMDLKSCAKFFILEEIASFGRIEIANYEEKNFSCFMCNILMASPYIIGVGHTKECDL